MKLVIEKSSRLVKCAVSDRAKLFLGAEYLLTDSICDGGLNSQNAEVISTDFPLPGDFKSGCFTYTANEGFQLVASRGDPVLARQLVSAERDRRIDSGFTFQGVRYQSRPEDRENIAGAATNALAAIVNNAAPGDYRWHGGDTDFVWIAADNSENPMDAQTVFAFGQTAMNHKQAHIFAARAIKDAVPIPDDFDADTYWP